MLTPLIYDPTIVKYNADLDTVSKVVDYLDKVQAGFEEKPKDFKLIVSSYEETMFRELLESLEESARGKVAEKKVLELVHKRLMMDEGLSDEQATRQIDFGLSKGWLEKPSMVGDVFEAVLKSASNFHFRLYKAQYVASMQLHQWDFETVFVDKSVIHDADLVYEVMKDPDFRPTQEQREANFVKNREQSFGVLMSMAGFKVNRDTLDPQSRVIQMATAYRILQGLFGDDGAKSE